MDVEINVQKTGPRTPGPKSVNAEGVKERNERRKRAKERKMDDGFMSSGVDGFMGL